MEEEVKPQVKKYIINSVSQRLNDCELFRNIFGKNFAKKNAQSNIMEVYEVLNAKNAAAEYDYKEKTVTIYNEKNEKFNVSDIKGKIEQKASHEVGHAIMLRTEQECEDYGIKYGTGIFVEFYDGTEMNRGLNEGYDNWMLEKAGIPIGEYNILTNIIRILELANGEESIMALGRGNPITNPQKMLEMTEDEYEEITTRADRICNLELSQKNRTNVLNTLINYQEREEKDEEDKKQAEENYQKLIENKEYLRVFSSERYKSDVEYAGEEDTLGARIKYLEEGTMQAKAEVTKETEEILEKIFEIYFEKEVRQLKNPDMDTIPMLSAKMRKLEMLTKLILDTRDIEGADEYITPYESPKIKGFLASSKELSTRHIFDIVTSINRENKSKLFRKSIGDMSNYSKNDTRINASKSALKNYNRGKGTPPPQRQH